jgi:hypothetical protein
VSDYPICNILENFSQSIFNLLFSDEKKLDILVFYGTISGQGIISKTCITS